MWRADSLENILMLGKMEGRRRRGWQRIRWLDGITDSMEMSLSRLRVGDGQGGLASCGPWGHKKSDTTKWLNWKSNSILWTVYFAIFQAFLSFHYILLYLYTHKVAFPEERTFCCKHESRQDLIQKCYYR